jgi:hypothetical protein
MDEIKKNEEIIWMRCCHCEFNEKERKGNRWLGVKCDDGRNEEKA